MEYVCVLGQIFSNLRILGEGAAKLRENQA